jgi:hypothetical protein
MLTGYIQRRKVRPAFRISPPERSVYLYQTFSLVAGAARL